MFKQNLGIDRTRSDRLILLILILLVLSLVERLSVGVSLCLL